MVAPEKLRRWSMKQERELSTIPLTNTDRQEKVRDREGRETEFALLLAETPSDYPRYLSLVALT
jgi:hypothetical protein